MKTKAKLVISVLGVLARSSFYKIIGIIAVMIAGEVLFLFRAMEECNRVPEGTVVAPEWLIEEGMVHGFFLGAVGLVMMVLVWNHMRRGEKSGYTMLRLRLTRKELFAIETGYHWCCLIFLFLVQIWVVILFLHFYEVRVTAEYEAPQLLFMTFYRNRFLHCLFPMQEIGKWIRNILMITALSMGAAGIIVFPGEKGAKYPATLNVVILMLMWFVSDVGKNLLDMCCDIVFLVVIVWEVMKVYGVFGRQEEKTVEFDV